MNRRSAAARTMASRAALTPLLLAAAALAQQPGGAPERPGAALEALRAANDPELAIEVRCRLAAGGGDADDHVAEVPFGEPFVVEVVRSWPEELTPVPFDPAELAPLLVEPLAEPLEESLDERGAVRTRRAAGRAAGRIEETLRWRAYAFRRGAFTLRPTLRVAAGGSAAERATTADPRTCFVISSLADDDSGALELPAARLATPFGWRAALGRAAAIGALAGLAVLAFGAVIDRRRASRGAARGPVSPAAAFAALAAEGPAAPRAARDDARAVQSILRGWLTARGIDARASRSADEVLAAAAELPADASAAVDAILGWSERTKFAGMVDAAARAAAIRQLGELLATEPAEARS